MPSKFKNIDILILTKNINWSDFKKIKKKIVGKNFLFLALDPASQVFLQKYNTPFITSETLLNSKTHKSILIKSNEILKEYYPIVKLIRFDKIDECIHNYINYNLLFKIREWLVILHMIRKVNMKEVTLIGVNEFLSNVLLSWCEKENIQLIIQRSFNEKFNIISKIIIKITNILLFELTLKIYNLLLKKQNKNQLFVTGPEYNLSKVVDEAKLLKIKFLTIYLTSQKSLFLKNFLSPLKGELIIFKRIYAMITPKYKSDYLSFKTCVDRAIQLLKLKKKKRKNLYLDEYLKNFIFFECEDLFRGYIGLKKIRCSNNNNLLFLSQHALGFHGLVGEFSNIEKISSLLITHGSHVKQTNKFSNLAWNETNKILINAKFTYSAMQTPIAYDFFCNEVKKRTKPMITGPMIFGLKKINLKNEQHDRKNLFKDNSKKFILLHAGTPKNWENFRPLNYETIDEYISNLVQIINAISTNKNIFLAIRFRETKDLKLSSLKALLPVSNSYKIYSKGTFLDYLYCSDLLISYSSVTIEEALINKKPVVLYNPRGDYFHLKGTLLEKENKNIKTNAIYNIRNKKNLNWGFNWLQKKYPVHQNSLNWDKYSFNFDKNNKFKELIYEVFDG